MDLSDGHKWLILWTIAVIIVGSLIGFSINLGNQQEHQRNMECVAQGKSYEPINDESYKMICK